MRIVKKDTQTYFYVNISWYIYHYYEKVGVWILADCLGISTSTLRLPLSGGSWWHRRVGSVGTFSSEGFWCYQYYTVQWTEQGKRGDSTTYY